MASLCTRCALRLQRAVGTANTPPSTRSMSHAPETFRKGLPTFRPTSNPELDALLHDFRYKHFLPAALEKPQWDLVFRNKNRNFLADNPQSVSIGREIFQLEFLGGYGVMPNRKKQLAHVFKLLRDGEPDDWHNLPNLLRGLHMMGKDPPPRDRAKIIKIATTKGQFGIVVKCLVAAQQTGLTLEDPQTLEATIWALRQVAELEDGSEEATAQAIKYGNDIAAQLESPAHGARKIAGKSDPRRNQFVLGVFLEMSAVYAYRFKGREDVDGRVRAYAERLLYNMSEEDNLPIAESPADSPGMPISYYAPILNGLKLADQMLSESMPEMQKAQKIIANCERVLSDVDKEARVAEHLTN